MKIIAILTIAAVSILGYILYQTNDNAKFKRTIENMEAQAKNLPGVYEIVREGKSVTMRRVK